MALGSVTLTFVDGHVEMVKLKPLHLVRAERHFDGKVSRIEGTLYAAWIALGQPGGKFDHWAADLDDMASTTGDQEASPLDPEPGDDD